jgi:hypothetical protein
MIKIDGSCARPSGLATGRRPSLVSLGSIRTTVIQSRLRARVIADAERQRLVDFHCWQQFSMPLALERMASGRHVEQRQPEAVERDICPVVG